MRTYSEEHVYSPPRGHDIAPLVPGLAGVLVAALDLPAAELLVQPPAVRAVAHLDVREPFRHNRDEGSIEANRNACARSGHMSVMKGGAWGLTDERDDEPALASMCDALQARPEPGERDLSPRTSVWYGLSPRSPQPPVALDDRVLYPVWTYA